MSPAKIAVLVLWACAMALWSMSVWGSWAAHVYEKVGPSSYIWYWLRLFRVPPTRNNCIRFLKTVSLSGMALFTLAAAALVLTPR